MTPPDWARIAYGPSLQTALGLDLNRCAEFSNFRQSIPRNCRSLNRPSENRLKFGHFFESNEALPPSGRQLFSANPLFAMSALTAATRQEKTIANAA